MLKKIIYLNLLNIFKNINKINKNKIIIKNYKENILDGVKQKNYWINGSKIKEKIEEIRLKVLFKVNNFNKKQLQRIRWMRIVKLVHNQIMSGIIKILNKYKILITIIKQYKKAIFKNILINMAGTINLIKIIKIKHILLN